MHVTNIQIPVILPFGLKFCDMPSITSGQFVMSYDYTTWITSWWFRPAWTICWSNWIIIHCRPESWPGRQACLQLTIHSVSMPLHINPAKSEANQKPRCTSSSRIWLWDARHSSTSSLWRNQAWATGARQMMWKISTVICEACSSQEWNRTTPRPWFFSTVEFSLCRGNSSLLVSGGSDVYETLRAIDPWTQPKKSASLAYAFVDQTCGRGHWSAKHLEGQWGIKLQTEGHENTTEDHESTLHLCTDLGVGEQSQCRVLGGCHELCWSILDRVRNPG